MAATLRVTRQHVQVMQAVLEARMRVLRQHVQVAQASSTARARVLRQHVQVAQATSSGRARLVRQHVQVAQFPTPVLATATLTATVTLTAAGETPGAESGLGLTVGLVADATKTFTPAAKPDLDVWIRRSSYVYPTPTLDARYNPVDWDYTSRNIDEWGYFAVLVDWEDRTFEASGGSNRIAVKPLSWTHSEPFGYGTCEIDFPRLSPFQNPALWLRDWADIAIAVVRPNGTYTILWDGLIASINAYVSEAGGGIRVQGIGVLHVADLSLKPPKVIPADPVDIADIIRADLHRARRPNLKNHPPVTAGQTGILVREAGGWEPLVTGYIQGLLSQAQHTNPPNYLPAGTPNPGAGWYGSTDLGWSTTPDWWLEEWLTQWTLMPDENRGVSLHLKDRETVHWTIWAGQPGMSHDVTRDLTSAPTTIFAEGVDDENCRWRNAKYPGLSTAAAPVFGGDVISPGETGNPDMALFEQHMFDRGWTGFVLDGVYSSSEVALVRQFQHQAGIQVDGIIGPQTWAAAFDVGAGGAGDPNLAWVMPLYTLAEVDPWNYSPDGFVVADNPGWDPNAVRIERYENFGAHVSKAEGWISAHRELHYDFPAGWVGTVTLNADPQEGSRFEIKAGQNILIKTPHGDGLWHIAHVDVDVEMGSVTLTVDERSRDYLTIAAVLKRDRDLTDPARRKRVRYQNASRVIEDRKAVWDCENGAGIIPRHATYQRLWNVLRIPASSLGNVVRAEFLTDTPARYVVGIFDRPVSHQALAAVGDPLDALDYWDRFPAPGIPIETPGVVGPEGLVIAWGTADDPLGYWPSTESQNGALTGRFLDGASWYYESSQPPWLWVAIYVESPAVNYFSGRLYPSNA